MLESKSLKNLIPANGILLTSLPNESIYIMKLNLIQYFVLTTVRWGNTITFQPEEEFRRVPFKTHN